MDGEAITACNKVGGPQENLDFKMVISGTTRICEAKMHYAEVVPLWHYQ